jgi:hypothetical protein
MKNSLDTLLVAIFRTEDRSDDKNQMRRVRSILSTESCSSGPNEYCNACLPSMASNSCMVQAVATYTGVADKLPSSPHKPMNRNLSIGACPPSLHSYRIRPARDPSSAAHGVTPTAVISDCRTSCVYTRSGHCESGDGVMRCIEFHLFY